jgi:hypothetical protein
MGSEQNRVWPVNQELKYLPEYRGERDIFVHHEFSEGEGRIHE